MKEKINSMSSDDVIQVMDGFFTTVGVYAEMPAFEACKTFDFAAVKDGIAVVTDAMTGDYMGLMGALYNLSKDAWSIYSTCDSKGFVTQAENGWKDVVANFTQEDYMKKISAQFESNMFQIMANAKTLYDNITNKQYTDFGKNLGSLMRLIFIISK